MLQARSLLLWTVLAFTVLDFTGTGSAVAQAWSGQTALGIQVEDKKGKALEGAEIEVSFVEQEPFEGPPLLLTDAAGFVELIRLAEGRWRIDVRLDGRSAYTAVVRIESGKKPVVTAGPIRDATAPPLKVTFSKSPDAPKAASQRGDRKKDRKKDQGRDRGREAEKDRRDRPERTPPPPISRPTPPRPQPVQPAPDPVPVPEPERVTPAPATPQPQPVPVQPVPEPEPQPVKPQPVKPQPVKPQPVKPQPQPEPVTPTPVQPAPVQPAPVTPAPPVSKPPVSEPTIPAPVTPRPAAPVQPPVSQEAPVEAPAPVSQRREVRAFTDPACPGCKAGEWAMIVEQEAAAGAKDCPRKLSRLKEVLGSLLTTQGEKLVAYEGSLLELLPPADAASISGYMGAGSGCQVVVAALPEGAKFAGYGYEVRDASGGGACQVGAECDLGKCRWLDHPAIEKAGTTTLVYGVFENRDPSRSRTARLILYFQPPRGFSRR